MFAKLFQWDEFLTPKLINVFFLLAVALVVLGGIAGIFNGLFVMFRYSFGGGLVTILFALIGTVIGIIVARISAEMILVVFKINDTLGDIRDRGGRM